MNKSDHHDTQTLRNNIEVTRGRMDETIDALGSRLQPRHLLDELLGFLRRHEGDAREKLTHVRESVSHSTESAMHSALDTIKKNPIPALLIGAGAAWFIYSSRKSNDDYEDYDYEAGVRYDPDVHIDRPLDYPSTSGVAGAPASWDESSGSKLSHLKDSASAKLSQAGGAARHKMDELRHSAGEKADHLRQAASEKMGRARQRAGEMKGRMQERSSELYSRSRDRVARTADHHPLEVGLACLATGLIAGLLIPTPRVVDRAVGERAERLRERAREAGEEMLERGKRVAGAAVSAAKDEAESQGLTPEHLRESASAVADRAKEAGSKEAHEQGLGGSGTGKRESSGSSMSSTNPSSPSKPANPSSDPTVARPAV